MILALIRDNKVVTLQLVNEETDDIGALTGAYQNAIDVTEWSPQPRIGWELQPDGKLRDPLTTVDWSGPVRITKIAFRQRMTTAEKIGILQFADGTSTYALAVRSSINDQLSAAYIDLTKKSTIDGVAALGSLGLLTSQRVHEILTTPPTADELYTDNL